MRIEWDEGKRRANLRKHGIDFADAVEVFHDLIALTREDRRHEDDRFMTLGVDFVGRLLVVIYTYPDPETIRVISARKAGPNERKQYEG